MKKDIEKFISKSKEFRNLKKYIKNNYDDFNILEIVGIGAYEIRHSNILSYFFKDRDFLEKILEKILLINDSKALKKYLNKDNKSIQVFREKDDIDLVLVDKDNKTVIVIENKLYAKERTDGDDGGQLQKYENTINSHYAKNWDKIFIYLTINLEKPSKKTWLKANYQMIYEVLKEILEEKEFDIKEEILIKNYIDLLKRRAIVEDKELKKLCDKIWENDEYAKVLDILFEYKNTKVKRVFKKLQEKYGFDSDFKDLDLDSIKRLYKKFKLDRENNQVFELQIAYYGGKDERIWIGFYYPNLLEQNNQKLLNFCREITKKKSNKEATLLKINKDSIEWEEVDEVFLEIINKIEYENERINNLLDKYK